MSSYTFAGIVIAGLALFAYFYFYQGFSSKLHIQPSAIHQPEHQALKQAGDDDSQ